MTPVSESKRMADQPSSGSPMLQGPGRRPQQASSSPVGELRPQAISRRHVANLISGAVLGTTMGATTASAASAAPLMLGAARPFSFAILDAQARTLAGRPYRARTTAWPPTVGDLDFDTMGQIRYRSDADLWKSDPRIGAVEFFHLGRSTQLPVAIHTLESGLARQIIYDRNLFDIPAGNPALGLPPSLGFAGFRVMNPGAPGDWIAYQGASYFRAADPFNQYGLSARGLAINTSGAAREEFPDFTAFWLERSAEGLVVFALLEGPSVTGAYRIAHLRGAKGLVQEIQARLYFRSAVQRLGLAPLTSMFWYGPADPVKGGDWRPQIHDSDGLSLWTGTGERIWRPLGNPPRVVTNAFLDRNPKGFGLMQRDRAFGNYQDDGAFYDRRPSAWVEPLNDWGPGSVQLVEIPTMGETDDNVVAFWTPVAPARAGDNLSLNYRLHWTAREPGSIGVGRVTATRVGHGGRPGQSSRPGTRKYVIDFEGGRLAALTKQSGVIPTITLSEGQAIEPAAYPVVGTERWRLIFDVALSPGKTLDLRAFLRIGAESLTETWVAQAYG